MVQVHFLAIEKLRGSSVSVKVRILKDSGVARGVVFSISWVAIAILSSFLFPVSFLIFLYTAFFFDPQDCLSTIDTAVDREITANGGVG